MDSARPASSAGAIEGFASRMAGVIPLKQCSGWAHAYFHPVEALAAHQDEANYGAIAANFALAGFMLTLVTFLALLPSFLLPFSMWRVLASLFTVAVLIVLFPIMVTVTSFIGSGLSFVIAKILGGKGSYTQQTLGFALVFGGAALMSLPFIVLAEIPIVGLVFYIPLLLISLYAFYDEYLVIKSVHQLSSTRAAAVIILPLLIVALLMFAFVGIVLIGLQSDSYWRRDARPFAISEHVVFPEGTVSLAIQNKEAGTHTITELKVGGIAYSAPIEFAPGETKYVSFSGVQPGSLGAIYEFPVEITYTGPDGESGLKQYGSKNLVGKYS